MTPLRARRALQRFGDLRAAQSQERQVGRASAAGAHHVLAAVGAYGMTHPGWDVDNVTSPELVCLPAGQVIDAATAVKDHDGVL